MSLIRKKCKVQGCTNYTLKDGVKGSHDTYKKICGFHHNLKFKKYKKEHYQKNKEHIKERTFQYTKNTITGFLARTYSRMKERVTGKGSPKTKLLYFGKPILPRDVFYTWSKNNNDFLQLYKRWVNSEYELKLRPTINRIKSQKGYTLDNMEWMTFSQNSGLAGSVRSLNHKKVIYHLLGVKTNGE